MKEIQIKRMLVGHLMQQNDQLLIGSEVQFEFGSRRADIISIDGICATAFEIKGAEDTVLRLEYQIESYKKYFDFCFVVCEMQNLADVRKAIAKDIGIIVVAADSVEVLRKSRRFRRHDKMVLSSTIPTPELKKLNLRKGLRSKHEICKSVSEQNTLEVIRSASRKALSERYESTTKLLLSEMGSKVSSDDILTITRMPPIQLTRKA